MPGGSHKLWISMAEPALLRQWWQRRLRAISILLTIHVRPPGDRFSSVQGLFHHVHPQDTAPNQRGMQRILCHSILVIRVQPPPTPSPTHMQPERTCRGMPPAYDVLHALENNSRCGCSRWRHSGGTACGTACGTTAAWHCLPCCCNTHSERCASVRQVVHAAQTRSLHARRSHCPPVQGGWGPIYTYEARSNSEVRSKTPPAPLVNDTCRLASPTSTCPVPALASRRANAMVGALASVSRPCSRKRR